MKLTIKAPRVVALSLIVSTGWAPFVQAQSDVSAEAEILFRDGKQLLDQKDFVHACPKLAESYRLDPATGALLNLAACNEGLGKTASAWAQYGDVASRSRAEGRTDREHFARDKQTALEPLLSKLTISVPPDIAAIPGLTVKRDATDVGAPGWNEAFPVDPGEHVVEAVAPGKAAWQGKLVVGPKADKQSIQIPKLDDQPVGLPAPIPACQPGQAAGAGGICEAPVATARTPEASPVPPASSRRVETSAVVLGSIGAGALIFGGIVRLASDSRFNSLQTECNNGCTIEDRAAKINDIEHLDDWAAGLAIGGAVLVGAAAVSQWAWPHESREHAHLSIDPLTRSFILGGQF